MCKARRLTGPEGKAMQVLTNDDAVINQRNLQDRKRRANGEIECLLYDRHQKGENDDYDNEN